MNFKGSRINGSVGLNILVIVATGQAAIDYLDRANFYDAMMLRNFKTGSFCIQHNLPQVTTGIHAMTPNRGFNEPS